MTIRHHLSDPLLMAHSAGALPEAFGLVVATHLEMCDDCRARLGACDALGGAVLEGCDPVALSGDALARTMARLEGAAPAPVAAREGDATIPWPLRDYVGGSLASVKWQALGMGVRQAILSTGREASARLLYIPGGQAVPDHGHRGTELTLVLQGAFRDAADRFGPGDLEIADEEMQHTPTAESGTACICLAATDAPLRFSGLVPRLAQPFFRI